MKEACLGTGIDLIENNARLHETLKHHKASPRDLSMERHPALGEYDSLARRVLPGGSQPTLSNSADWQTRTVPFFSWANWSRGRISLGVALTRVNSYHKTSIIKLWCPVM